MTKSTILALNLNLSNKDIIKIKKLSNITFLNKKIIINNFKLYGNFILLKNILNNFLPFSKKIIPIIYIKNNINISIEKYKQINKNKNFQKQTLSFINTFK